MPSLNMHAFRDSVHLSTILIFSNNCAEDRDEVGRGRRGEGSKAAYQGLHMGIRIRGLKAECHA